MDRLIYIAMSGAQQLLQHQAMSANNLANASTSGFKAEVAGFRTAPVTGPGQPTRAYAVEVSLGANLAPGAIQPTGRDLDIAIEGDGFLAVQATDGTEAYTRNGSLTLSPEGELRTRNGRPVLGDGGPISVPEGGRVSIGRDGTVFVVIEGQGAANGTAVGRLKLVNPAPRDVIRGADGLFRTRGAAPAADDTVIVAAGALESSNVNAVGAMVDMINLARQFEMQMRLLQNVEANEQRATSLLSNSGA